LSWFFIAWLQIGDGVSLLLFSSEFFFSDMEVLAVAGVSFCNPINDYSYKWDISGTNTLGGNGITGNTFRIPPGTLKSGDRIEIVVSILNNQEMVMSSVSIEHSSVDFLLEFHPSRHLSQCQSFQKTLKSKSPHVKPKSELTEKFPFKRSSHENRENSRKLLAKSGLALKVKKRNAQQVSRT
jgi:hypothetical protein